MVFLLGRVHLAWAPGGTGIWEDDDAADWATEVAEGGLPTVTSVLKKVAQLSSGEDLEAPVASCALAAADVVAALRGHVGQGFPDEVRALVSEAKPANAPTADLALLAVERVVAANSELLDLWREADDQAFSKSMADLRERLNKPKRAIPRPRSARAPPVKVNVGDILEIPVGPTKKAYAYVIAEYARLWPLVAFFGPFDGPTSPSAAVQGQPTFLAELTPWPPGRVDWNVVANVPIPKGLDLPGHKIGMPEGVMVEDFHDTQRRPATPEEVSSVPYRSQSDARNLDSALRALAGLEPWKSHYESYRPNPQRTGRRLFESKKADSRFRSWFGKN